MLAICKSLWSRLRNADQLSVERERYTPDVWLTLNHRDMFTPSHAQFHPTTLTVMGQINQALTGYGAVSVYGPQVSIFMGKAGIRLACHACSCPYDRTLKTWLMLVV